MGNVDNWLAQGILNDNLDTTDVSLPFSETTNYLKKVVHNYKTYKILYPNLK